MKIEGARSQWVLPSVSRAVVQAAVPGSRTYLPQTTEHAKTLNLAFS